MSESQIPSGMVQVKKKSALPIYAIGGVWLFFLYLRPLYKMSHFITAAVASLAVYLVCSFIFKPKVFLEEAPQVLPQTGNTAADSILAEGAEYLKNIDALSDRISDNTVKIKVDALEQIIGQTLMYVEQNPQTAPRLDKYVSYYLPTLQKLVSTYIDMESRNVRGENITATLTAIDKALDTLQQAFRKQLDALYGNTALDISTDITVLENMLAQQGLNDDGNQINLS